MEDDSAGKGATIKNAESKAEKKKNLKPSKSGKKSNGTKPLGKNDLRQKLSKFPKRVPTSEPLTDSAEPLAR